MTKKEAEAMLRKIVAAVARERGGGVVDLPQIESDVKMATLVRAIEEIKERFAAVAAAGPMPAGFVELTQSTLQVLPRAGNPLRRARLIRCRRSD